MKADPEDLHNLASDLDEAIQRHQDAIKANPDIASDLAKVRDKTVQRYENVTEGRLPKAP